LSSFDEYSSEVKSGRLEWSPVHKSEKFWRENAARLCEKNFELLKILIKLLETSKDPLILCVAVHDLGEYVRHYPRGKTLIETLGGKTLVMAMLSHDDQNVRYESLLAVQKLMVHNWEYLGKQLDAPSSNTKEGGGQSAVKAS
jgi:V-type H+-transporting ATPase subunit H